MHTNSLPESLSSVGRRVFFNELQDTHDVSSSISAAPAQQALEASATAFSSSSGIISATSTHLDLTSLQKGLSTPHMENSGPAASSSSGVGFSPRTSLPSSQRQYSSDSLGGTMSSRGSSSDEMSKTEFRKALFNRLDKATDVPSMDVIRAHYLIYEWQQRESQKEPLEILSAIQGRLAALIRLAREEHTKTINSENPSHKDYKPWVLNLLETFGRLECACNCLENFLQLYENLPKHGTVRTSILQAIGGQGVLDLLKSPRVKEPRQEGRKITQLHDKLSTTPLSWQATSLSLLRKMSLEQALRGVATDNAIVIKELIIRGPDGNPVQIPQDDGSTRPLRQKEDYRSGAEFQREDKQLYICDIVSGLHAAGYCPTQELQATVLDAMEKVASESGSHAHEILPLGYTLTSIPRVPEVDLQNCRVTADEKIVIEYKSQEDVLQTAATVNLTWALTYDQEGHDITCQWANKSVVFEAWVPEELRPTLERLALRRGKEPVAFQIANSLQRAGYRQAAPLNIPMNVQRIMESKLAGCSLVMCALSNGSFAPAATMHRECMKLSEGYSWISAQGRKAVLDVLNPKLFMVTAQRDEVLIHRSFDDKTLEVATQTLVWALTCNEEEKRLSGDFLMSLKFQPWVPDEERIKILNEWKAYLRHVQ